MSFLKKSDLYMLLSLACTEYVLLLGNTFFKNCTDVCVCMRACVCVCVCVALVVLATEVLNSEYAFHSIRHPGSLQIGMLFNLDIYQCFK